MADVKVILVPPGNRDIFLKQPDAVFIQSEETDEWERPKNAEESFLNDFLQDKYSGAPKRFWNVRVGTRIGFNREGVFIHENHCKRYYGLDDSKANVALRHEFADAVPLVDARGEKILTGSKIERTLLKMLDVLPSITDDMRYQVLHASFQRADRNGNGKLSRPELGLVLRRVLNTLRAEDIEDIIRSADSDEDGAINYQEFVAWLRKSANSKVGKAFGSALKNESDVVRATFRLWDKNGDGLVPDGHLYKALRKIHPDFKESQVRALVKCMDCDHDGNVDYDEFVDFLFQRAEKS